MPQIPQQPVTGYIHAYQIATWFQIINGLNDRAHINIDLQDERYARHISGINADTHAEYRKKGRKSMVINISAQAAPVVALDPSNGLLQVHCRMGGKHCEMWIPVERITDVFGKDTGVSMNEYLKEKNGISKRGVQFSAEGHLFTYGLRPKDVVGEEEKAERPALSVVERQRGPDPHVGEITPGPAGSGDPNLIGVKGQRGDDPKAHDMFGNNDKPQQPRDRSHLKVVK